MRMISVPKEEALREGQWKQRRRAEVRPDFSVGAVQTVETRGSCELPVYSMREGIRRGFRLLRGRNNGGEVPGNALVASKRLW
jgi:hypothetical protein